jgi:hypothetical protein
VLTFGELFNTFHHANFRCVPRDAQRMGQANRLPRASTRLDPDDVVNHRHELPGVQAAPNRHLARELAHGLAAEAVTEEVTALLCRRLPAGQGMTRAAGLAEQRRSARGPRTPCAAAPGQHAADRQDPEPGSAANPETPADATRARRCHTPLVADSTFRSRRAVTPDGTEWRVGRRWLTRGMRHNWAWRRKKGGDVADFDLLEGLPGLDLDEALLFVAAVLVVLLVLIPLLLFGFELVLVGCVLAASLVGRLLLGRPWLIEARTVTPASAGRVVQWQVSGWRQSNELVRDVAADLTAGRDLESVSTEERGLVR